MATVEQQLKKRKKPDQLLSHEEILKRRRNRDDIRNLYDSYRRIRFCVSQKDYRLMPDFEQAYLSLITASRGCTSVQRIVAELIPRYASFCPTALEAATQVSINMYSWSLNIVMKGEDIDGVAYQTAKACIYGLVEICSAASQQKPTSSVISGICSAVFQTVLNFFVSTFENKDIYTIGYSQIEKLQEPLESFSDLNREMVDGDETPQLNLFNFRVLCLFRIFMCYPKNIIDACFEILVANKTDVSLVKGVEYFLRQLTSQFNANEVTHSSDKTSDGITMCAGSAQGNTDRKGFDAKNLVPNENKDHEGQVLSKNSFIEMVFHNEPSLKCWMLSIYKKLCESFKPEDLSVISVFLEKIFGSLSDAVKEITSLENNNKPFDSGDKCTILTKNSDALNMEDVDAAKTKAGQILNLKPLISSNVDSRSSLGTLKLAAVSKSSLNELNDPGVPAGTSISNSVHNIYQSPSQQSSYSQISRYRDGDPASMDVFSASNLLWIGCLGHRASESLVRAHFEDFGPLICWNFFSAKSNALVEYKNLFDAVRARNYMQGSSVWGGRLRIKFLDGGFGSKRTIKNLAIGNSCYVYVGKVMTKRENDDILHILKMAGIRKPHMYDLSNENSLILQFLSAEEATNAMAHIRHFRCNSTGSHLYPSAYSSGYYTTGMEIMPPNPYFNSFAYKPEGGSHELVSPRLQMLDVRPDNFSGYGRSMHDQPYAGHMTPYGTQPCAPSTLPPQIQPPQPFYPIYYTPSNPWDNFSPNASMTYPDNHMFTPRPTVPFIPSSITPVSQLSVISMANAPVVPPPPPNGPPHSPSPPPPPPSSPPPELVSELYKEPLVHYPWEGTLSKSGVRYCKIYATREDLSDCKYLNDVSEPSDWPANLDVTKRTDIRHVKTTFANTRPHRREVCRLLPSTPSDHKGLQDFISYLKQRDCAGVIKIPSGAFLWARLLFIVPPSPEICSLLGVSPQPTNCLLAVVLPKDSNSEGA